VARTSSTSICVVSVSARARERERDYHDVYIILSLHSSFFTHTINQQQTNSLSSFFTQYQLTTLKQRGMKVDCVMDANNFTTITSEYEFAYRVKALFTRLHTVLEPLLLLNENMTITESIDPDNEVDSVIDLNLGPLHGAYRISTSYVDNKITMISPVSGANIYVYVEERGWIGERDAHDFEGMLTRDLIRQVYGVPNF
jgi:frataxin-like iron-binding protein CyaY